MDRSETNAFNFTHQGIEKNFKLLTMAMDASISGIVITDNQLPDNPIIYCNTSFERISGYQRSEIIGRNCRFLQGDDRLQSEREKIRDAVKEGKATIVEIRNYKKDGSLFWNELYISPIKDETGAVTHYIGVQNDITRRKKAEIELLHEREVIEKTIAERTRSLKNSQDYMQSIIQTIRESLIVLNPGLRVLSVNEHFLRTFKVTRAETEGQLLYNLGNGQWDIPKLKQLLEQVLPTNNPVVDFEVEHDFPHIGGKLMLLNAHRVELEGEFKDWILIAIEDITERRSIEKRKDDFLSIASHELRTPLTTIKGYVELMHRYMPESASERFKEVVSKTGQFVERLSSLISELLDINRIQSGHLKLKKHKFNFDGMVKHAVENIQAISKLQHLTIDGTEIGDYYGDELQLTQVLVNILSNAVKFAPDSSDIKIYKSLVSDYLKISVSDKGLGISTDDKKHIFEKFYRASDIHKTFPGMGIGLYFCNQIIELHEGTLWVDSELGNGSTFSFTLPLKERDSDD